MTTPESEPDPDALAKLQIERINELTSVGRTNWFGLLAFLVFTTVTVLGVQDADFFVPGRQTQLPLVNVSIPTRSFFIFAPILGTALYVYLHLHLRKVIAELLTAKARVDDDPLERHLNTWLLVDFILRRRRDGSATRLKMDWLATITTFVLIWVAGPFVISMFWWRSWPAHEEWLTLGLSGCLALTLYAGMISWSQIRDGLSGHTSMSLGQLLCWIVVWCGVGFAALLGLVKTETGTVQEYDWFSGFAPLPFLTSLAEIEFGNLELPDLPPDQRNIYEARAGFRHDWCNRRGIDEELCVTIGDPEISLTAYQTDLRSAWCAPRVAEDLQGCSDYFFALSNEFTSLWATFRSDQIAALDRIDWTGLDLRNANLNGANLRGAILEGADLAGAALAGANFEETHLSDAQMQGAVLISAQMQGAVLRSAQMQGADLRGAELQGAALRGAQLDENTDLTAATLRGAAVRSMYDTAIVQLRPFWWDVFADGTVQLPVASERPTHWADEVLSFRDFEGQWRAWQTTLPD